MREKEIQIDARKEKRRKWRARRPERLDRQMQRERERERGKPFDVSRFPVVLPRDGGGFRAWNPPWDIHAKWISCTLGRITR